jgi:hypothetical protein
MKQLKCAVAALIAGLAIQFAPNHANALSGAELYGYCLAKEGTQNVTCSAYIRGLLDGLTTREKHPTRYCTPEDGIDVDQARLLVEKYLQDHQEKFHQPAGILASLALMEAFPCPQNGPPTLQ